MSTPLSAAWTGDYALRRVRAQEQTDVQLAPLGQLGVQALQLRAAERVLDVGCGAGATVLELARAVGPSGHVCGVDVSEAMLARARERVAEAGCANVQLLAADASSCSFERPFDALYSRFGVMFFEDFTLAFENLHRALAPGGRFAFVCWQALARNPWAALPLAALQAAVPDAPLPEMFEPERAGPFYFGEPERALAPLRAAGFHALQVSARALPIHIGNAMTLEAAVEYSMELGPPGRFVIAAGERRAEACRQTLREVLAPYTSARGTWMDAAV